MKRIQLKEVKRQSRVLQRERSQLDLMYRDYILNSNSNILIQLNSSGLPKSETQLKLEKIKERKRMIAEAEKEKFDKSTGSLKLNILNNDLNVDDSGGRHHSCSGDHAQLGLPSSTFGKRGGTAGPSGKGSNSVGNKK